MAVLRLNDENPARSIKVQTRAGTAVENYQYSGYSSFELGQMRMYDSKYDVQPRTEPSPMYNCHGLVFAARRTGIYVDDLQSILDEDGYSEITDGDAILPGDIILYFEKHRVIHSGVIVEPPLKANLHVPTVVSKWGRWREVLHPAHVGPYGGAFGTARYFRVTK